MTHTLLPLAVVTMLPVMNQIDRRLLMAASTLGANGSRAFWAGVLSTFDARGSPRPGCWCWSPRLVSSSHRR